MVVDLEEPQTPYPESERERGRKVAREFFDSLVPGELPLVFARVQPPSTGQTLKDLRAVVGPRPRRRAAAEDHSARPTCTRSTRCSRAPRSTSTSTPGQLAIYPILETAQAIRLAYEIAIASPRVSHMGGALSRFGDIHQALGYRWTAEGEETLFLRSKVLVDAKAAGIRYPISGMWGGALDDLDGLRAFATGLREPRVLRDDARERRARAAGARGVHADGRGDRVLARARRAGEPRPSASGSGPIRHGDPRQGEAHVVHIAHVGSARKNLAWARDLGVI